MKTEDIKKRALKTYYHTELWENFTHIVIDRHNYILAAFYNEWDAEEYKEKFNEQLYIVELDYEKLDE